MRVDAWQDMFARACTEFARTRRAGRDLKDAWIVVTPGEWLAYVVDMQLVPDLDADIRCCGVRLVVKHEP